MTTSASGLTQLGDGSAPDEASHGTDPVSADHYERSPRDVVRLAVAAVVTLASVATMALVSDAVLGFERDLIELFSFLSPAFERILAGALQILVAAVSLGLWLVPITQRRWRMLIHLLVGIVVCGALMELVEFLLDRDAPTELVDQISDRAGIAHSGAGSTISIAQLVTMMVIVAPLVTGRWRRAFGWIIVAVVTARLTVAAHPPADVLVAVPLGVFVGAGMLWIFGRPSTGLGTERVQTALAASGLPVTSVRPAKVDARGSTPYFATLHDGTGLFVKIVAEDNRAAGLLFWVYRSLRLKNVGDERPYSTLRRGVEHEAFVSLLARDIGVRTPRIRAVANVGPDALLQATEQIAGRSLDSLDVEEMTDELLVGIWEQVAILQAHRVAHRDLRLANVFVADDGQPWLIDFGFAEVASEHEILDADVAQLLASLSTAVSSERAVESAVAVLGSAAVGRAVPRLQMPALAGATQSALKEQKGVLDQLVATAAEQSAVEEIEQAELERLSTRTIVLGVVLVGVAIFLLPQLADLPSIIDQIQGADWSYLPWILLLSLVTYVGATVSISGAVPGRLPAAPTFVTQLASSFASKVAPAGLGGMALNVRYLQTRGIDPAVAVAGVGMNSVGGFVMHLALSVVFIVWAGQDGLGSISLPEPQVIGVVLGVLVGVAALTMLIPAIRRLVLHRLLPALRRSVDGVQDVLQRPGKVTLLLGGSAIVTLSYIISLYLSSLAFDGDLPFATIAVIYLVGAGIASAVPTPGGLGAQEAALVAGLVAVGMDSTIAIPAVFLYRLATFWLPILPGSLCFRWLQRQEYI